MTRTLSIDGMSCKHCVQHVREALESVSGVEVESVDLAAKRAVVSGQALDEAALKAAVAEAGYEVVHFE